MQTGIYPAETPGGWQLIGRTPLQAVRSVARRAVSASKAGDAVQFYADRSRRSSSVSGPPTQSGHDEARVHERRCACIKPGMLTTVQDRGRWGFQSRGVPVAGPMDPVSHRLANALVGNDRDAATLEVTLLGPELEFEDERLVAVAGAEFELTRRRPSGADATRRSSCRPGRGCGSARARAARARTSRSPAASPCRPVLGSRATHLVSAHGRARRPAARRRAIGCRSAIRRAARRTRAAPSESDGAAARPSRDAFACCPARRRTTSRADALDALQSAPYAIGQQLGSHGIPARGPAARARARRRHHLRRDAARRAAGAGVRTADSADGRSPDDRRLSEDRDGDHRRHRRSPDSSGPGDTIAFAVCTPREALAALIAQERALMAVESRRHERLRRRRCGRRSARSRAGRTSPLAPLTTFRVGGPADWLLETRSSDEIVTALRLAHAAGVPVTMLGGGSNVLVADAGVRGLVIRPRGGEVRARRRRRTSRADAAVTINGLVRWTINHGRAGLEAWAGTPGTVGGAIFGNAHFGGRLIGDLVDERPPRVARRHGRTTCRRRRWRSATIAAACRTTGEILLSAVFRVPPGDPAALRATARAVAGVPQADAAARHAERRLHLPESRTGPRPRARRHPVVGRRARRSRGPEGRGDRRRPRLADARQLHRQRRDGDRRATSAG